MIITFVLAALVAVQADYALIKGAVFTADGRALPGAKLTVVRVGVDEKQQTKSRKEMISDRIGEFAFRVEPGPAKYRLTVEAKGFAAHDREVEIFRDERTDISIVLKK